MHVDGEAHILFQVLGRVAQDFTVQVSTPVDKFNALLDIFVHIGTIEVQPLVHGSVESDQPRGIPAPSASCLVLVLFNSPARSRYKNVSRTSM